MGDMADFTNSDRMSEWEFAMDNEFADSETKYELGLCDEHGFVHPEHLPGLPVVDTTPFHAIRKIKVQGKGNCPLCGNTTHLITGKFGKFYGCDNFPTCKGSRNK